MKKLFILSAIALLVTNSIAQSVTVSFTGKNINDDYLQIDSIKVINLTENKFSVYNYPDTIVDLMTVGINNLRHQNDFFELSQNVPNPFNGTTNFTLSLVENENVRIKVTDMLGRKVIDFERSLEKGTHSFTLTLGVPQVYFLTAYTKNQKATIKMVNMQGFGSNSNITYNDNNFHPSLIQKAATSTSFNPGDTMQYIVYYNGIFTNVVQPQSASENFVFTFDETVFVDKTPKNRTVLIEEYTGNNCGYCPDGHRIADSLVAVHAGDIYNMNIHAGSFSSKYKTSVGTLLNNYFYVSSYPAGVVSREVVNVSGTYKYPISRSAWGYVAQQLYTRQSYVNLEAKTTIDTHARKLNCEVQAYFTDNSAAINGKNYIHIAVLQDSIWGPQSNGQKYYPAMYDSITKKYCHNHMLRELILGVDGENMGGGSKNTLYNKTFSYDIPLTISDEDVILDHLQVLVFITEGEPSNSDEYKNNKERVIYVTKSNIEFIGEE
ncbi:MAG: Omp28-related outer membrane protein [Bacteroidales bacterium]|jgi:hypothetical protein|nr:Omp28-related outer membrane protein [Bacteroidales bacterium]